MVRGATTSVQHAARTWYLQCAVSTRFMQFMYGTFALPFMGMAVAVFSLVLAVVFGACAFVTLKYTLKPLQRISDAAGEISPRSLKARLQTEAAPTEIAPLVESFNRVLDRLEHGYRTQREFLATAAHELKTPLALIRAQVELSADGPGRMELLQDVEHMSRQVQQLLHLAEASEVQNYQIGMVDVRAVADEAAQYLLRMAQANDVRVVLPEPGPEVHWLADRGALFTLLKNLLENAIQHTPAGSRVDLELDTASLTVRDWGPGASDAQLSKIFIRFWRGDHRRDQGAGLGLAICQEIALAHGWTLTASRANPGLRVVLAC
jgi:signal transduction histidine kinase